MPSLLKSLSSLYPSLLKVFLSSSPEVKFTPSSPTPPPSVPHKSPNPGDSDSLVSYLLPYLLSPPSSHLRSGFRVPLSPSPKPLSTAAGEIVLKCPHCTLGSVSFWLKNLNWLPIAFRRKPKLLSEARHGARDSAQQTSAILSSP